MRGSFLPGGIYLTPKVDMPYEDQETIISYCKLDPNDRAEVYSTDKIIIKRYNKFCKNHPDLCEVIHDDKFSTTFSVDIRCAGFYPRAPKKGRPMTEEQRIAASERLAVARMNKA
jgi:hypothetical protein